MGTKWNRPLPFSQDRNDVCSLCWWHCLCFLNHWWSWTRDHFTWHQLLCSASHLHSAKWRRSMRFSGRSHQEIITQQVHTYSIWAYCQSSFCHRNGWLQWLWHTCLSWTSTYRLWWIPFLEEWGYATVIGMLMHLAGNTCPDIVPSVHQASHFTHCACKSHSPGVKRILRYLKRICTEGLILKPGSENGLIVMLMPILADCFLFKTSRIRLVSSLAPDMSLLTVGLCCCWSQRCKHKLH